MNRLLSRSGLELARMIRQGEVRSVEVVDAHIRRIQEVNPRLNLMVRDRFGEARRSAREADDRIANGDTDLPLYFGVPCTIKESIALAGMPNSTGLVARKNVVAEQDATVTARLRAAGAIPMGVTNTSELCMWMESANQVYGRSRNPYDPTRIVGGSSGGEGGIIGAGASPFGLGSDVGGSIRMPAFFNGVFGHKPTGGLVPFTGQHPPAEGAVRRYVTTGPLTRRAEDLMPMLRLLAGPDGEDEGCREVQLGEPDTVDTCLSTGSSSGMTLVRVAPASVRALHPNSLLSPLITASMQSPQLEQHGVFQHDSSNTLVGVQDEDKRAGLCGGVRVGYGLSPATAPRTNTP